MHARARRPVPPRRAEAAQAAARKIQGLLGVITAAGGPGQLAWAGGVILVAYALRGATGFGAGVVSIPLLLLALPLGVVIPLITALGLAASAGQALHQRRWVDWAAVRGLFLPSLVGVAAGLALFAVIDPQVLLKALAVFIIGHALWGYLPRKKGPDPFFAWLGPAAGALGLYDARVLWLLAAALPVVLVAMVAGDRWHASLDEARFGHVVAALLVVSGAALLFK